MYTVRWKRSALDHLTELWLDSADRAEITEAAAEIDRLLSVHPNETGESRSESIRVHFVPPLGVFFELDEPSRTVNVLRVWTF